eukprot:6387747-Pyramimonas_sp.AAC.1
MEIERGGAAWCARQPEGHPEGRRSGPWPAWAGSWPGGRREGAPGATGVTGPAARAVDSTLEAQTRRCPMSE